MATSDKLERVRNLWDQRAVSYTETSNKLVTVHCARQLYDNMKLETATSVIEVAAGAGLCAKNALDLLACGEATGGQKKRFLVTDLSPVMVDFAKKNLSGLQTDKVDVQVQEANGQDLVDIASGSMDRYMASLCLHICPDPDALLREARHVITDDGLAGFTIWGRPEFSGLFTIDSAISKELGKSDGGDHPNFSMGKDLGASAASRSGRFSVCWSCGAARRSPTSTARTIRMETLDWPSAAMRSRRVWATSGCRRDSPSAWRPTSSSPSREASSAKRESNYDKMHSPFFRSVSVTSARLKARPRME